MSVGDMLQHLLNTGFSATADMIHFR